MMIESRPMKIMKEVCAKHLLTIEQLRSRQHQKLWVLPRRQAAERLRYEINLSLAQIGRFMHRERSSVHRMMSESVRERRKLQAIRRSKNRTPSAASAIGVDI